MNVLVAGAPIAGLASSVTLARVVRHDRQPRRWPVMTPLRKRIVAVRPARA